MLRIGSACAASAAPGPALSALGRSLVIRPVAVPRQAVAALAATSGSAVWPLVFPALGNTATASAAAARHGASVAVVAASHLAAVAPYSTAPAAAKYEPPVFDFSDSQAVYAQRSDAELRRAYWVFSLCRLDWLVNHSERLLRFGMAVASPIALYAVRKTFFAHFCAGEDEHDIQGTIKQLASMGVGSILDYAAEAEEGDAKKGSSAGAAGGGSGSDVDPVEALCDANTDQTLRSIQIGEPGGFVAVKVTALANPSLLRTMTTFLQSVHDAWTSHFGDVESVDLAAFHAALGPRLGLDEAASQRVFNAVDDSRDGMVHVFEWLARIGISGALDRDSNPDLAAVYNSDLFAFLDDKVGPQIKRAEDRLFCLAALAAERSIRLLVDAEHQYMQHGIDYLTLQAQKMYNTDNPVVFNTYQCYLKDSETRILRHLNLARAKNYKFATKLVRGAYMVHERREAKRLGVPSPVHETKADTDANYNACVRHVLETSREDGSAIMVASHNADSLQTTANLMADLGIPADDANVAFAQLLGMADPLTLTLGQAGYNVYKYVPYGPIELVLPYLIRRAQENKDAMNAIGSEVELIAAEIKRRKSA